jgi:hypothetical protein
MPPSCPLGAAVKVIPSYPPWRSTQPLTASASAPRALDAGAQDHAHLGGSVAIMAAGGELRQQGADSFIVHSHQRMPAGPDGIDGAAAPCGRLSAQPTGRSGVSES